MKNTGYYFFTTFFLEERIFFYGFYTDYFLSLSLPRWVNNS
jgi:hypothetical protein